MLKKEPEFPILEYAVCGSQMKHLAYWHLTKALTGGSHALYVSKPEIVATLMRV
jgi:hypothetical protein